MNAGHHDEPIRPWARRSGGSDVYLCRACRSERFDHEMDYHPPPPRGQGRPGRLADEDVGAGSRPAVPAMTATFPPDDDRFPAWHDARNSWINCRERWPDFDGLVNFSQAAVAVATWHDPAILASHATARDAAEYLWQLNATFGFEK